MKGTYNNRREIRTEDCGRFLVEMMGRGSFPFMQTGFPVMENCTNSELCVLDESSTLDGHIGFLGLNNLQSTGSYPFNMMGHHHHHRPLLSSSSSFSDNTVPSGPACISGPNQQVSEIRPKRKSSNSIYYHDGIGRSTTTNGLVRTLQPFDISSRTVFKSPAGGGGGGGNMAGVGVGFPFTWVQWKELQRQAMVYKYMMHSVPVPPHLLLPFPTALSSSITTGATQSSLNNGKDAEPGRCKRTDGKKWRCSRDVAPHQKYCERHLHRGRPRSRKPVELVHNNNSNKKTRQLHNHHSLPPIPNNPKPQPIQSDENVYNRGLDWAIVSDQQWQHLLQQTNLGGLTTDTSSVFHQDLNLEEPQNQIPYTDFGAPEFFNPDLVYYLQEQPQLETPIRRRGFIDAWSNKDNPTNTNKNESSVSSSNGNHLSPSSLTLSMAMAAGDVLDKEMGQIQMGLGVTESDHEKPQNSSWLMSPVSWVGSEPGGPLAEALRLSGGAAVSSDSTSGPATRVSSPSGVLQRTMVSMSDNSSGCNSPTIAVAPEVMRFQWLI